MTTHETVNQRYSQLQTLLQKNFGAEGRGIVEMVRSVEAQLSTTLSWELRAIAHIRNKVVHEGLVEIPRYFEPLCKEALAALKKQKPKRAAAKKPAAATKPKKASATKLVKKPAKKVGRATR